ncbi:MAG: response regulator [Candidatus Rokubacteria bacterium]|nr:response regulator [Candidatus Rokubacteria bacterium]
MGRRDPLPRETLVGVQVLVVDDDGEACELLATILGYCGALVTTSTSAEQAVARVTRVVPDIVVCDIVMGDRDGYWLLDALRRLPGGATLPIVAVTGFDDVHTAERTLSSGFNGHVRKPIDPWELARLVAALTRGRT